MCFDINLKLAFFIEGKSRRDLVHGAGGAWIRWIFDLKRYLELWSYALCTFN